VRRGVAEAAGAGRQISLDRVIEVLTDAVVVVDERGEIVLVNAAAEALFGYDRAELVGASVELLLPEHLHELHRGHRAGFVDEPHNRPMGSGLDLTARRKDGGELPVEIGLSAVRTDQGLLVAAVITDITARHRLEEALVQTRKLEAVGRLAGGIAHDFNNMLTAILGYAGFLLAELEEGSRPHHDALEIRAAAQRAADLTRRLLVFSRGLPVSPRVLDLNRRVRDLEVLLARVIGEDVEVEARLDDGVWPVKIDPGQLDQVVTNVVLNARDAMANGGQLTIETRNVTVEPGWPDLPAGGEFVSLTISDTGAGMDDETRRRALEPFFTTKEPGTSAGLGLATVYGIVDRAGGTVHLYSEPGLGTTVKIYLPRAQEQPAAEGQAEAEPVRGAGSVLLVEDEPAVRGLVSRMLEELGYDVLVAGSPREALETFEACAGGVEVLVTDVVMPELAGTLLAEQLLERSPSLRVLFMSGYTEDVLVRRSGLTPRSAFVEKPFTVGELGRALAELLAR